jgi:hypothetical protein
MRHRVASVTGIASVSLSPLLLARLNIKLFMVREARFRVFEVSFPDRLQRSLFGESFTSCKQSK